MSATVKNALGLLLLIGIVGGALLFANRPSSKPNTDVPIEMTEQLVLGEMIYQANCSQCHGNEGAGYAQEGMPAPALNGSEHAWHHPDAQMLTLIRQGGNMMPAVGADWDDEAVEAVWAYVKQWWSAEQKKSQRGSIGE